MKKINTSITIDKTVLKDAKEQAKFEKRSFSSLVELLIEKYLTSKK
jgi:hypothetical protein